MSNTFTRAAFALGLALSMSTGQVLAQASSDKATPSEKKAEKQEWDILNPPFNLNTVSVNPSRMIVLSCEINHSQLD